MTVLQPPPFFDPSRPVRDIGTGHPTLQARWAALSQVLARRGVRIVVNEVYRYDARQQWLFGAGRTGPELQVKGISPGLARPDASKVTNAWSAGTSAHGCTRRGDGGILMPAAAALDVVPVGKDGRPWTQDDDWTLFLDAMSQEGYALGLVHFHAPGLPPSDKPHLQLKEWSDATHSLNL